MATADLVLNFLARDKASSEIDKVKKSLSGLEKAQSGLGRASQLLGAGAIIAFGAASVRAFAEAEQSQVRLQEAYRKFPAIANVSIQSMRDLNTAIMEKTGADDDELAAAEANLAMYGLTGTQIQQLIPLVNDLAVAKGVSLTDASKSVGMAMMGNARALKGIGVDFKATGNKAEDFATILGALQTQVGGAGDAFGATAAGSMAKLQTSFENLQEAVGEQLAPALSNVVQQVIPLLNAFGRLSEPVKSAIVWFGAAGAAALVAGPRILSMAASLRLIFPAATQAAAGLTAEAAAAEGAGAASVVAGGRLSRMSGALKGVGIAGAALAVGLPIVGDIVNKIGENMFGAAPSAESLRKSLEGIAKGSDPGKIGNFGGKLHDLGSEIEHLDNPGLSQRIEDFFGLLAGQGGGQGRNQVLRDIQLINDAIAQMAASGNIEGASAALAAMEKSATDAGASSEAVASQFQVASDAIDAAKRSASDLPTGVDPATTSLDGLNTTTSESVDYAKQLDDAAKHLKESLDQLGGKALTTDEATSRLYDSFDSAASQIKEATKETDKNTDAVTNNRQKLDLHTEAGRVAQAKLADIRSAANSLTTAYIESGKSAETIATKQREARAAFIAAAKGAGLSEEAAKALADQYGLIPSEVDTKVKAYTKEAADAVLGLRAKLDGLHDKTVNVWVTTHDSTDSKRGGRGSSGREGPTSGKQSGSSGFAPQALNDGLHHSLPSSPKQALEWLTADTASLNKALDRLKELKKGKADEVASVAGGISSSATLFQAFDLGKQNDALQRQADAKQQVTDATNALAAAQAKLRSATTRDEQTAALEEQAKAERDLAAAKKERAAADKEVASTKHTAGNVLAGLQAKSQQISSFYATLKRLKKRGLPLSLMKQLIEAGPVEGSEMATVLDKATASEFADILRAQKNIDTNANNIGNLQAGYTWDPLITSQEGVVSRAAARARQSAQFVTKVEVKLDGKKVAEALAAYRKAIGGVPLGLG